jgi:hypothetical protein
MADLYAGRDPQQGQKIPPVGVTHSGSVFEKSAARPP